LYKFAQEKIDVEEYRARLRKLDDAELLRYGLAARRRGSPGGVSQGMAQAQPICAASRFNLVVVTVCGITAWI